MDIREITKTKHINALFMAMNHMRMVTGDLIPRPVLSFFSNEKGPVMRLPVFLLQLAYHLNEVRLRSPSKNPIILVLRGNDQGEIKK